MFEVNFGGNKRLFQAESESDRDAWVCAIKSATILSSDDTRAPKESTFRRFQDFTHLSTKTFSSLKSPVSKSGGMVGPRGEVLESSGSITNITNRKASDDGLLMMCTEHSHPGPAAVYAEDIGKFSKIQSQLAKTHEEEAFQKVVKHLQSKEFKVQIPVYFVKNIYKEGSGSGHNDTNFRLAAEDALSKEVLAATSGLSRSQLWKDLHRDKVQINGDVLCGKDVGAAVIVGTLVRHILMRAKGLRALQMKRLNRLNRANAEQDAMNTRIVKALEEVQEVLSETSASRKPSEIDIHGFTGLDVAPTHSRPVDIHTCINPNQNDHCEPSNPNNDPSNPKNDPSLSADEQQEPGGRTHARTLKDGILKDYSPDMVPYYAGGGLSEHCHRELDARPFELSEAHALACARDLLVMCNRTQSGGDTYFCIDALLAWCGQGRDMENDRVCVLTPLDAEAAPLVIRVDVMFDDCEEELIAINGPISEIMRDTVDIKGENVHAALETLGCVHNEEVYTPSSFSESGSSMSPTMSPTSGHTSNVITPREVGCSNHIKGFQAFTGDGEGNQGNQGNQGNHQGNQSNQGDESPTRTEKRDAETVLSADDADSIVRSAGPNHGLDSPNSGLDRLMIDSKCDILSQTNTGLGTPIERENVEASNAAVESSEWNIPERSSPPSRADPPTRADSAEGSGICRDSEKVEGAKGGRPEREGGLPDRGGEVQGDGDAVGSAEGDSELPSAWMYTHAPDVFISMCLDPHPDSLTEGITQIRLPSVCKMTNGNSTNATRYSNDASSWRTGMQPTSDMTSDMTADMTPLEGSSFSPRAPSRPLSWPASASSELTDWAGKRPVSLELPLEPLSPSSSRSPAVSTTRKSPPTSTERATLARLRQLRRLKALEEPLWQIDSETGGVGAVEREVRDDRKNGGSLVCTPNSLSERPSDTSQTSQSRPLSLDREQALSGQQTHKDDSDSGRHLSERKASKLLSSVRSRMSLALGSRSDRSDRLETDVGCDSVRESDSMDSPNHAGVSKKILFGSPKHSAWQKNQPDVSIGASGQGLKKSFTSSLKRDSKGFPSTQSLRAQCEKSELNSSMHSMRSFISTKSDVTHKSKGYEGFTECVYDAIKDENEVRGPCIRVIVQAESRYRLVRADPQGDDDDLWANIVGRFTQAFYIESDCRGRPTITDRLVSVKFESPYSNVQG
jgi:hypothetical protein